MSSVPYAFSTINGSFFKETDSFFLEPNPTSYLGKHFVTRLYHLLAIPVDVITRLADGILGLAGFIAVCVTGGKTQSINKFSLSYSTSFAMLPAILVQRALLVINSKTEMREQIPSPRLIVGNGHKVDIGVVSASFFNALKPSKSRLVQLSLVIPLLITSVVDGIFGMLASIFSLVTLGVWTKCNNFAYEHLDFKTNIMLLSFTLVPPKGGL